MESDNCPSSGFVAGLEALVSRGAGRPQLGLVCLRTAGVVDSGLVAITRGEPDGVDPLGNDIFSPVSSEHHQHECRARFTSVSLKLAPTPRPRSSPAVDPDVAKRFALNLSLPRRDRDALSGTIFAFPFAAVGAP